MCDKRNYTWEYCIKMLKILIAGTVASRKEKKLWNCISDFFHQELPYTIVSIVIAPLLELQQEDPMAQTIQKR